MGTPETAPRRVIIEGVTPEIDAGRYPAKRTLGDEVVIGADLVADGHDIMAGALRFRHADDEAFSEVRLTALGNDRFEAGFVADRLGRWQCTLEGWVDRFATWRRGFEKKVDAGQDVDVDLQLGRSLVKAASERAEGPDRARLVEYMGELSVQAALSEKLLELMERWPDRSAATRYGRTLEIVVDPVRARFSSWYEFFPRSFGPPGEHGTFADAEKMLPYVAALGFDVLYLPPIHPIGKSYRKGRNNSLHCEDDDPGSPWAIGAEAGGHTAIHPALGTLDDFRRFRDKAREHGLELALDIAFQASPDHPWVKEHPEWFQKRPDGTIQYAENPPKKYQDIYPLDFETAAWRSLWEELKGVFEHWIGEGVSVFRVDNPHTKSLPFWEWCITELKREHPEVIFLAEAFTRPKLMYSLAKGGFSQSYTYFTWRHTKHELQAYLEELTQTEVAEFFRPNFWPNTPDILPEDLQHGGRPAFLARLILAGTLSSSWGVYGPAFELMEHVKRPGSEEYIDNEKYELKTWNLDDPKSLRHVIARLNKIRKEHPALHDNRSLTFHATDSDHILCYSKQTPGGDRVLVVVNLDYHHAQDTWLHLDMEALGLPWEGSFSLHDLLSHARYEWFGAHNYVRLDPHVMPAHIFEISRPT